MSERKMHYFEFHFQKILAATKGWKDDEFGAFVKLLIEQFDRGFIPDDPEELSRLITTHKKNWPRLAKKFTAPSYPGELRNAFMITIRDAAHERSSVNAINGKIGAEEKKRKRSERLAIATALGERMDKQSTSQPVTSNQVPEYTVVVKDAVQQQFFEMFRRVAGNHITDTELDTEISKFRNKYGNAHPYQSGSLINTWVANIGNKPIRAILSEEKRMVL